MKYFVFILAISLVVSGCGSPRPMEQLELQSAMDLRDEREARIQASAEKQAQQESATTETNGV